jgi:hypothetical protein
MTDQFIQKAKLIHGDKYDYSESKYINQNTKLTIKCNHCLTIFERIPYNHIIKKSGCIKCHNLKNSDATEQFSQKAKLIHGDKYDYSESKYINQNTKLIIKCNNCLTKFKQIPYNHIEKKSGCIKCHHLKNLDATLQSRLNEFIKKAKETHKEKYNYSKVVYTNSKTPVIIICNLCNSEFQQTRNTHLRGDGGCKVCAINKFKQDRTFTPKQFLEKAKLIHGDKYDYSQVNYINSQTKITIKCNTCLNNFEQKPNNHLQGNGCDKCAIRINHEKLRKPQEKFIIECQEKHKDKNDLPIYDYSMVEYKSCHKKIIIICKIHGQFEQVPSLHLSGSGCNDCGILKRNINQTFTNEIFIKKAKEKHGDKFDYSQVNYINSQTKIIIKCNTCENTFEQQPSSHLQGYGCDKCAHKINHENKKLTTNNIIIKAKEVHGDIYDYSNINYVNSHIPIDINCKICNNKFAQLYGNHVYKKQGCPFCSGRYMDTNIFINNAKKIHNDNYNYDKVIYKKSNIPIKIICNKTNKEFLQTPNSHLSGSNCPCCSIKKYSLTAIKYLDFIARYYNIFIKHYLNGGEYTILDTILDKKYKADGYCEETNTIYEFHGTIYHGDPRCCNPNESNYLGKNYGELYQKTLEREQQIKGLNYNLIVMWEYDWNKINKSIKILQKIFRNSKLVKLLKK